MVDEKVVVIMGYILLGHANKLSEFNSESSSIQEVLRNTSHALLYFLFLHSTLAFQGPAVKGSISKPDYFSAFCPNRLSILQ